MKVSFDKNNYKKVERFNDKVTVVTLEGVVLYPIEMHSALFKNPDIEAWVANHTNPKMNTWTGRIIAKGKAMRAEGDADDPILAERIAECRAKIAIYKFIATLINKCIDFYVSILIGKGYGIIVPKMCKGSLCGDFEKYHELWEKEQKHLLELKGK